MKQRPSHGKIALNAALITTALLGGFLFLIPSMLGHMYKI